MCSWRVGWARGAAVAESPASEVVWPGPGGSGCLPLPRLAARRILGPALPHHHRPRFRQAGDLLLAIAELAEDLAGVLAEHGRRAA